METVENMAAVAILVEIIRNKAAAWKRFCAAFFTLLIIVILGIKGEDRG